MSRINAKQVSFGGNFTAIRDFANKVIVKALPFVSTQIVSPSGVNVITLPNTILSGFVAVGNTSTVANDGSVVAAGGATIGTGSASNTVVDSLGNITNLVELRDSTTKDLLSVNGNQVYGLIQTSAADNTAIAAANVQMSFVIFSGSGFALQAVTGTNIEFQVNKAYKQSGLPTYEFQGGNVAADLIAPVTTAKVQKIAKYVVTTAYPAGAVINLVTGAGTPSGASTVSGDSAGVSIDTSSANFLANNQIEILLNGVDQDKGSDFIWDTATTGHFALALDVGDVFKVFYWA